MSKKAEDLISDIYKMLDNNNDSIVVAIDSESKLFEELGKRIASGVERQMIPRSGARKEKVLYMSEVGTPCTRKLWYSFHMDGVTKEQLTPSNRIKFMFGDILEELVLFLASASGHEVTDEQKGCVIELPNGWQLRGRMDAKIDGEIVDVKSASTFAFDKFKKGTLQGNDPFGYIEQLSSYNDAEKVEPGQETSFVAIDKQHGHLVRMPITYEKHESTEFYTNLTNALDSDVEPVRAYESVPDGKSGNEKLGINCSYCAYKQHCWRDSNKGKGIRTFLYSNKPRFLVEVSKEPRVLEIDRDD